MFCYEEEKILQRKFINKRVNAKKEGIPFNLTLEEFRCLVEEAKLLPSQLGYTGEGYVLARYKDQGDYSKNNCRFITQLENAHERVLSEKARANSQQMMTRYNLELKNDPQKKEEHNKKIIEGIRKSSYYKKRKEKSLELEKIRKSKLNPKYTGNKNPMFGCYWITNGKENKVWKNEYGEIPEGFYRGRIMKP